MLFLILIFAAVGLLLSVFIYWRTWRGRPLHGWLGHDCQTVLSSRYRHLLGIPNELLGILYYLLVIGIGVALLSGMPVNFGLTLALWLVIVAALAALFALALLYIQLVVLQEWCEYCLVAALDALALGVLFVFWWF
ncbi:hypothetical protein HY933_03070 [Candidatus Falkowbacteria bacterium]|nr:hypothetical protein [Candidatus Falkowbacteria bacterium]